jgi:hypothetical protein
LAHRTYPALPENHVRREAGRALTNSVGDPDIKMQLLLGGEKMVNGSNQKMQSNGTTQSARDRRTTGTRYITVHDGT